MFGGTLALGLGGMRKGSGMTRLKVGEDTESRLIDLAYQAAVGLADWRAFVEELAKAFPESAAFIVGHDHRTNDTTGMLQYGFDPAFEASFISKYASLNPLIRPLSLLAAGTLVQAEDLIQREEFLRSEFYLDWLRPQGSFETSTGLVMMNEHRRQVLLSLRYGLEQEHEVRPAISSLLMRVAPHIQRAVQIERLIQDGQTSSRLFGTMLERLPYAAFLVDRTGHVNSFNRQAEQVTRAFDSLVLGADGSLRATTARGQSDLDLLLRDCFNHSNGPSVIRLSRQRSVGSYYVGASPIQMPFGQRSDHGEVARLATADNELALVFVVDGQASAVPSAQLLASTFNLTQAEAGLAQALSTGETLARYAQRREVSKQTLRNQLVGLLKKTDTHRQAELAALMIRLGTAAQ
jgi:DNA-binding CsgD family transcriptional regulator